MIYTKNETEYVSFNEATGFETASFVDNEDVPEDFKKMALKIVDAIEKTGIKKARGGPNETLGDALINPFTIKMRKRVEERSPARSYFFSIPQKWRITLGINPSEYKDFADKIFKKAGLKKGQEVAKGFVTNYYYKKSKDKENNPCYYLAWFMADGGIVNIKTRVNLVLQCVVADEDSKSFIESFYTISSESAADEGFEVEVPDNTNKDNDGFENHRSLEDYLGYNPDQGLTRSEELSKGPFEDYFKDPKVMGKFSEHMDISDNRTRKFLINMNEADQNAALLSLASKLYDNIVVKVDDIDYGDIPNTKGDITKLPNYEKLRECIELLRNILVEYKQDTKQVDEVATALANVMSRKDLFGRAFKMDVELPIIMYNNIVLSIIDSVSLTIASSIEFIKVPNQESFEIVFDKVAYSKTRNNMLFNCLKKFNKSCSNGDFDKAMEHVIKNKIKNGIHEAAIVGGIAAGLVLVLSIIPILKELVFFFYYTRMRVSEFFDIQADLLQMNAYNVKEKDDMIEEKKERVIAKQLKTVELFRKIANKISFTNKKAEVEATKEINNTSKKMKIDDIGMDDSETISALF